METLWIWLYELSQKVGTMTIKKQYGNALDHAAMRLVRVGSELEDVIQAGDNEHGMLQRFEFGCQEDGRT